MSFHVDPLADGISRLRLLDSMGNSLSVVNDARQSFDASSEAFSDRDRKLLNYLAKHKHTSPFRGVAFKWEVRAPLFVARQWWKHVVASSYVDEQIGWNEKSFRYCSAEDVSLYCPAEFKKQAESNRQASGEALDQRGQDRATLAYWNAAVAARDAYRELIAMGVSREQARGVLPTCMYVSFVWTCSLHALLHFISLRKGEGAQSEIAQYANSLLYLARPVAPEVFEAFENNNYDF